MMRLRRLLAAGVCLSLVVPHPAWTQSAGRQAAAPKAGAAPAALPAAQAMQGVTLDAAQGGDRARLVLTWPAGVAQLEARASLGGSLLLIRLPRALDVDPAVLAAKAPDWVAAAALSADRRTIRIALVQGVRVVSSRDGAVQAFDILADGAADPPPVTASSPLAGLGAPPALAEAGAGSAGSVAGAGAAPATPPPLVMHPAREGAPRVTVSAAAASGFTRLRLTGTRLPDPVEGRRGDRAAFAFPGNFAFDLGQVRSRLPQRVSAIVRTNIPGHTAIVMDIEPGSVVRTTRDGTDLLIDILPPGAATDPLEALKAEAAKAAPDPASIAAPPPAAAAAPAPPGSDGAPTPDASPAGALASGLGTTPAEVAAPVVEEPAPSGRIPVTLATRGADAVLSFGFERPAAASVFRRGNAVYVLFASSATVDTSALPPGRVFTRLTPLTGDGVTGLRLEMAPQVQVTPQATPEGWSLTLSARKSPAGRTVAIQREQAPDGTGRIKAVVPDAVVSGRFTDPEAGDDILVGLALGPASALARARSFLEASIPESMHGVAVIPRTDTLELRLAVDGFVLVSPDGMILSRTDSTTAATGFSAAFPAFVDMRAWRVGPAGAFMANLQRLRLAAAEEVGTPDKGVRGQLDLARFLLAWELAPEALGVLRAVKASNPTVERAPEVLGLTGAALALMGRGREALDVLGQPELMSDPAAHLWAALASQQSGDPAEARARYEKGEVALAAYVPEQQALFRLSDGEAALALGDTARAGSQARQAVADATSPRTKALATLLVASAAAVAGAGDQALAALDTLKDVTDPEIRAKADLAAALIGVDTGKLSLADAIRQLDALRFAWRGDDFEIELLRRLGGLYIQGGDIRSGLSTMGAAATLRPDLPAARALRDDLAEQFRRLFLEGGADGMDPIQALALFYDFRHLTPVGPEGDRMVRGLADRLVGLDLLPQAAELLQHQVDNRLQGFAKAQVATDLAAIYLLDRQPEKALQAIWNSRVAQLPEALNSQRRLIEAVAMTELGRNDHALELLEFDTTADAARVRTEVNWRAGNYVATAREARATLPAPGSALSPEQAGEVLRAAIAANLAGERATVDEIARGYGTQMARSAYAEAFKVVTATGVPEPAQLQAAVIAATGASPFPALVRRLRERVNLVEAPLPGSEVLAAPPGSDAAALAGVPAAAAAGAAAAAPARTAQPRQPQTGPASQTRRQEPRRGETRSATRQNQPSRPKAAPKEAAPAVQAPRDPPPAAVGR